MSLAVDTLAASMFLRGLNVLSGLIDRAVEAGLDEAVLMEARLAPDMRPFPDQVRMAAFSARSCVARLTDQPWPKTDDAEASLAELKETVALSIAFVEGVDAAAFEGAETRRIELRFPGVELNFEGQGYLTSFALPNFYFHLSMAYALLRQAGVPLGKRDFLGQIELI
ncbi:hypothetical protein GCM10007859_26430 [Brevundimonas denitrificans]|uniref:DUF1993 domain-containing protein n=1 Tax=Brevundimonas denitrificans TaxID=1443434 RepID=A0ABQ6BN76_9CAUL|nr:DUF1993 domain-containing protein [Brevundimonas denitrificans]GLS02615.1 hypothetical protein GCM10007859_26430 [Brevundimonas denitrificans]